MNAAALLRWMVSLVGTLALAGLVWVFGPLLVVLEEVAPRMAVVGLMLVLWACINLLVELAGRSRDRRLSAGVVATAEGEEAQALEGGLARALALLGRKQKGRLRLYEQPWYMIIGPPGAGKTTALLNAGLGFPLAAEMGKAAVPGVGGTRLCDWWFTDDAVLIDTAGRYTTQDSNASVDRAGWEAFLDLLRRTRPRQPLNGVIVAIALSDIAANAAEETARHARAISLRLRELETRLGLRLPVYALFTKADLIVGFSEYFAELDRDGRRQVWGVTYPLDAVQDPVLRQPAALAEPILDLARRLDAGLVARLATEPGAEKRSLIAGFPMQVASLAAPLARFLDEAFGAAPVPLLRGAYFASGTQEGTPIDRLTGVLSRGFGLDQRRAANLRPEQGRSYFLGDLLTRVVFAEALLASDGPRSRRRRLLLRGTLASLAGIAVLGAALVLWRMHAAGQQDIEAASRALLQYEQAASQLPLDPVADDDLRPLAPLLDLARSLPHRGDADAGSLGLGLSQEGKLGETARTVYRHALQRALLPRLVWRVEALMRSGMDADGLYEATRIDLMLGGLGRLDPAALRAWFDADWQKLYPATADAPLRASLSGHLAALLAEPLPAIQLDGALIAQARARFRQTSLAQRVYARIAASAAIRGLPAWTPAAALGPAGARLFVRPSGRRLEDGVPGLYTRDGFARVLLPAIPATATEMAGESWVLGEPIAFDPGGPQLHTLQDAVVALYGAEDIAVWDRLLADLDVTPLLSLSRAAQDLYILASPQSPLRRLLASVAHEVRLEPPGEAVAAHFQGLAALAAQGAGPLDAPLQSLYDLQQQLAKFAAAPIGSMPAVPAGADPAVVLRAQAARLPPPVSRWMTAIAASGSALRSGNARQQIGNAWNVAGGAAGVCAQSVKGHFPFERTATADLPLVDFSRLLAAGGVLDGFFSTQLAPYVDTSSKPWRAKAGEGGAAAPVASEDVAQFQRAAALRDLFFPDGATTPGLQLDITPLSLDAASTAVTLDLDGTEIRFAHGRAQASHVVWPGANRMQTVRLLFDPPAPGAPLADTGPWALFRMVARARQQPTVGGGHTTLVFQQGDRKAEFDLKWLQGGNPFAPGLLDALRCPSLAP